MNVESMNIVVVGCGVSGLTTGVRLLEEGHNVEIWARDLPPNTVSNVAAAIWHPYKAYPIDRVVEWGRKSFEVFSELSGDPATGIIMREAVEIYSTEVPDPEWRDCVRQFRRGLPEEMIEGYTCSYVFETPVVEMSIYLPYMMARFRAKGGKIVVREISSLGPALDVADMVVNCAGLGSMTLVGDSTMYPIRGQVVRVEPSPIDHVLLDEEEHTGVTYIIPRSRDCYLGGTAEPGNWSLEPDMATAEAIIERTARIAPEVRDAPVVEHLVGLRPGRDTVRLEREVQPDGKVVIHNYGHGGAGVTLSWGCAEEVASLVAGVRDLRVESSKVAAQG
ncbi:MAG TPA: FAD-dependent oxidoreductase [Chloroflexia bacterium]|nr:FAD-dependent oxidoreductase [Chloroflexia bacterium]